MKTKDVTDLEGKLRAAFEAANMSRREAGLPLNRAEKRRTRGGQTWVGPRSYKVTLWLAPWEYLQILEDMRATGWTGGLTGFVKRQFKPKERRAKVVPISLSARINTKEIVRAATQRKAAAA